jgi:hypothetical protein
MTEWKWSNGIPYQRSPRSSSNNTSINNQKEENDLELREYINPVARALNDTETWSVDGDGTFYPTIPMTINQETYKTNDRELSYDKMASREMMVQTGQNPFLNDTNYANNVSNNFLTSVSTSQDKVKQPNL